MFGHQDDNKQDTNNIPEESIDGALGDQAIKPDQPKETPVAPEGVPTGDSGTPGDDSVAPAFAPDQSSTPAADEQSWQHPGAPLDDTQPISDVISPAGGYPKPQTFPQTNHGNNSSSSNNSASDTTDPATNELIDIKQHALTELAPFVDDLDLNPEDKFRTIMMIIQASDDQSLVSKAYKAAHDIEDEKVRAQALLDIVNEINYFTHQASAEA